MVIIWLNGAWGSGKTHTAAELSRRIKNSFVYDPEEIGYCLRKITPRSLWNDDFQDNPLWRTWNIKMLRSLVHTYGGIIFVPMTIINPAYYEEIIGSLRCGGADVRHFVLSASKKTLLRRLHKRFESKKSWAGQRVNMCIQAFENPVFENKIITDGKSVPCVAEEIAKELSLPLLPRIHAAGRFVYMIQTKCSAIRKN